MMNIRDLIALLNINGIGPSRARRLIDHFGSPGQVMSASLKEISQVQDIGPKTAGNIVESSPDYNFADEQLKKAEDSGSKVMTYWDDDYPALLKAIFDPPLLLFIQGQHEVIASPSLAVVGTRLPSQYGSAQTRKIVAGLVASGLTIISGMARGVDSIAHKAALEAGGKTAAVFGCGLDKTYPPENEKLRKEICNNGAIISEFPFGTMPNAPNFPQRNRIISGLSFGTLVIEAGEKSGALITAKYTLDENREAFALPGDVNRPQSNGCNKLIRECGAMLVSSHEDILRALEPKLKLKSKPQETPNLSLTGQQLKVYEHINYDPIYIDDLAQNVKMSSVEVTTVLFELIMMDAIRELQGKRYVRYQ